MDMFSELSTTQIANILGINEETVRRWGRIGKLKGVKKGKGYVFKINEIADFLKGTKYELPFLKKVGIFSEPFQEKQVLTNLHYDLCCFVKSQILEEEIKNQRSSIILAEKTIQIAKERIAELEKELEELKKENCNKE